MNLFQSFKPFQPFKPSRSRNRNISRKERKGRKRKSDIDLEPWREENSFLRERLDVVRPDS